MSEEALAWGLADRVVPQDQLRAAALELAAEMAAGAPLAVQSVRRTLRGDLAQRIETQTEHEYAEQQRLARTEDHAERSEEHTSELQSLMRISYAVFCLKKK